MLRRVSTFAGWVSLWAILLTCPRAFAGPGVECAFRGAAQGLAPGQAGEGQAGEGELTQGLCVRAGRAQRSHPAAASSQDLYPLAEACPPNVSDAAAWMPDHPWAAPVSALAAYRLLAPERLPPALRRLERPEGARPPDYTALLLTLSRSRDTLPPFLAERLDLLTGRRPAPEPSDDAEAESAVHGWAPGGEPSEEAFQPGRPRSAGAFVSERFPLRVHYRTRFTSERARQTLAFAEAAYAGLLEMGFTPPVPDGTLGGDSGLDVYLVGDIRSGGGAFTAVTEEDADPTDGAMGCEAYVMVFEELEMETEMPVFVAHEIVHAFQAAMDYTEGVFFWESTAVAIEDLIFEEINDYYSFIDDFQKRPHYALNDASGLYPYGAGIFAQFLDEVLGAGDGTLLADLWRGSSQRGAVNEPDYLDVIDQLAAQGSGGALQDLPEVVALFTGWRYFAAELSQGDYFEEAAYWPSGTKVPIVAALTPADLPALDVAPPSDAFVDPQDFGVNYYTLDTRSIPTAALRVTLRGQGDADVRWGLVAIRYYDDDVGEILTLTPPAGSAPLTLTLPVFGADHVVIAPANLGTPGFDADAPGSSQPYLLDLRLD